MIELVAAIVSGVVMGHMMAEGMNRAERGERMMRTVLEGEGYVHEVEAAARQGQRQSNVVHLSHHGRGHRLDRTLNRH